MIVERLCVSEILQCMFRIGYLFLIPIKKLIAKHQLKTVTCLSMIRWLLRKGPTRSHSELGRETFLRQWYFSLSCGRVGNCRIFNKHELVILLIHCVMASPSKVKNILNPAKSGVYVYSHYR